MNSVTQITVKDDRIFVSTHYRLKEICKSIRGAEWNPFEKKWMYNNKPETAVLLDERFGQDYTADDNFKKIITDIRKSTKQEEKMKELPDVPNVKFKPWNHQKEAFWFAIDKPAVGLFMDMGTGKSKVTVDILNNKPFDKILIVCPLSVVGVWSREFEKHGTRKYYVLPMSDKWTMKKKVEMATKHIKYASFNKGAAVIVINYDSVWREEFKNFLLKEQWDSIICDESHRIKSPASKVSWFFKNFGKRAKHKMCLTGTPMPNNPDDIYAQYRFLDPEVFGSNHTLFKARYAIPLDNFNLSWTKNPKELTEKIYSIAFRVTKDILDLPPAVHEVRDCELSTKGMKMYREMEDDFYLFLESGDEVTTTNVLTRLLRLQQMANGFVKEDGGKELQLDNPKKSVLNDILQDIPKNEKVVVFSKFTNDLKMVKEVAESSDRKYGEVSGHRKDLTDKATFPDDIDLLGVQISAGGAGIDLSKARYCIYYSVPYNLGDYEQSLARCHRPGQENKVFYIHLVTKGTIDQKIYEALEQKKEVINLIMENRR